MWWWLTQRSGLRVINGVEAPTLVTDTIQAPTLSTDVSTVELVALDVPVPSLEADPVMVSAEQELEGGQIV